MRINFPLKYFIVPKIERQQIVLQHHIGKLIPLKSFPEKPDAVFILTNPKVTEQVVQQCVECGIKHVWMHCMMGTKPGLAENMTSVSQEAAQMCREHGIAVIPGSCPNQFLNPDFGHKMMRVLWRTFGFMNVN